MCDRQSLSCSNGIYLRFLILTEEDRDLVHTSLRSQTFYAPAHTVYNDLIVQTTVVVCTTGGTELKDDLTDLLLSRSDGNVTVLVATNTVLTVTVSFVTPEGYTIFGSRYLATGTGSTLTCEISSREYHVSFLTRNATAQHCDHDVLVCILDNRITTTARNIFLNGASELNLGTNRDLSLGIRFSTIYIESTVSVRLSRAGRIVSYPERLVLVRVAISIAALYIDSRYVSRDLVLFLGRSIVAQSSTNSQRLSYRYLLNRRNNRVVARSHLDESSVSFLDLDDVRTRTLVVVLFQFTGNRNLVTVEHFQRV